MSEPLPQETYRIRLRGIKLFAYHGAYPPEQKIGRHFELDLTLDCLKKGPMTHDKLDQVLSYDQVVQQVQKDFTAVTFNLLETAAEAILEGLGRFSEIALAKVCVKKFAPPTRLYLDHVSVEMTRSY